MNNVTETGEIEMNNIYVQIRIYTCIDTKKNKFENGEQKRRMKKQKMEK